MLNGKWWLRPDGASLDVSATEHALIARRVMLGLTFDEPVFTHADMFNALTSEQLKKYINRGVPRTALEFLSRPNDPRIYAIQQWGWIRVRRDRFYLGTLNDKSLQTIRQSGVYWQAQGTLHEHDMIDVVELAASCEFALNVSRVRDCSLDSATLRASANRPLMPRRQR